MPKNYINALPEDCQKLIWKKVFDGCIRDVSNHSMNFKRVGIIFADEIDETWNHYRETLEEQAYYKYDFLILASQCYDYICKQLDGDFDPEQQYMSSIRCFDEDVGTNRTTFCNATGREIFDEYLELSLRYDTSISITKPINGALLFIGAF